MTLWHIPINKICRIEKESFKARYHGFNLCTKKILIYTSDNDSFELYNVFQENEFLEIEAELKKIADTNKASANEHEALVVV